MFSWLTDLIPFGLGTVDKLTQKVRDMVATLWSALVSFFTEQMNAAGYVTREGTNVFLQSVALGGALYRLGFFILVVSFPRWLQTAFNQAAQWAGQLVAEARRDLGALVADVRQFAVTEIDKLRAFVHTEITDARNTIASILTALNWVRDRVAQYLTDPTILAQWILVPLWHVAKQWVESNAEALGRWALGIAVRATLGAAAFLEDIIVKIF